MSERFHILEERHQPHVIFKLWERARNAAVIRDRLPVVFLSRSEWQGRLIVIHESDLSALSGISMDRLVER